MKCPVCSNDIQDSFGLIECSQCQTMLVADIDGNLKKFSGEDTSVEVIEDIDPPEVQSGMDSWDLSIEPPDVAVADATETLSSEPTVAAETFQEIQDFANSEESNLVDGEILYHLFLDDIHTQEVKNEVEQVLIDPKLKIDFSEKDLESGKLTLKNINPVKVSVIVSKLKHLQIKINWIQNSLVQGESK